MKVGDLVKMKKDYFSVSEESWIGVIIDFKTLVDTYGEPLERYAIVRWNEKFHEEEEYQDGLEVIG
tara:strand:+ start:396 stop:593 length:198 start_codon:yes stop_codon:yes gene_type:complete